MNPLWMETAALVLVARRAVEAYGQRGSWVTAQRLQRAGLPMMLSRELQRSLDHATEDGLVEIRPGSTVPVLTGTGMTYLLHRLTDRQREALRRQMAPAGRRL